MNSKVAYELLSAVNAMSAEIRYIQKRLLEVIEGSSVEMAAAETTITAYGGQEASK